jgi:hypothetical protein
MGACLADHEAPSDQGQLCGLGGFCWQESEGASGSHGLETSENPETAANLHRRQEPRAHSMRRGYGEPCVPSRPRSISRSCLLVGFGDSELVGGELARLESRVECNMQSQGYKPPVLNASCSTVTALGHCDLSAERCMAAPHQKPRAVGGGAHDDRGEGGAPHMGDAANRQSTARHGRSKRSSKRHTECE